MTKRQFDSSLRFSGIGFQPEKAGLAVISPILQCKAVK
jgi:hypothetical protein